MRTRLFAAASIGALATASAGSAQTAASAATNASVTATRVAATEAANPAEEIIVTGSLLRRTNTETPSPVTVVTAAQLQQRGINTIADAIQTLSSNNAGALPVAFTANGAFANGASGASLRGLTTDSTLVLFDGLRAAYYPLADDGVRNFVDLNTIPDAIVDRVENLRDGASSNYGADAVAGVINVILKREIRGFQGSAEAGISSRGDAGEQRISMTYGYGSLSEQGFNIYVNGEYQRDHQFLNSDRSFPFNTSNLSRLSTINAAGNRVYGNNNDANGIQGDGSFAAGDPAGTVVPVVRASNADGSPVVADARGVAGSPYQLINPAAGCRGFKANNIGTITDPNSGLTTNYGTLCEVDGVKNYGVVSPAIERIGGTIHATARIGEKAEAYAVLTYYQANTSYPNAPANIRTQTNNGDNSTEYIVLPPTLTNGQLNPNDPFAAQGQYARLYYRFGDIPSTTSNLSRTYRGAIGIKGSFGDDWRYTADATGMESDLRETFTGVPYFANLRQAIADGSYNFVDPSLNSQAVRNFIAPTDVQNVSSKLYQGQATIAKDLFHLPGGRAQLLIGGSARYEEINDPSANPPGPANPDQQYFPLINGFGAKGHRYVYSGFFEADAPVFDQLEILASGRYDNYSTGFDHFSPKVGLKFTPVKQLILRGTFSKGFRTPSFAETGALPTTGFTTVTPGGNTTDQLRAFNLAHGNDAYTQPYSLGLTTAGTPTLKPETSTNFTAGLIAKPTRWLSFTADYYNISKKSVIVGADYSQAVTAYYNGQTIPTGFGIVQDIVDPQYPNAQRRIFAVNYGFVNANSLVTDGIDFGADATINLPHGVKWTSSGQATFVLRLNETFPVTGTQHYAGTLGPFAITSASGTPQWRAQWQNTFEAGIFTLSGTAYYTSGYIGAADDYSGPGTGHDCANAIGTYRGTTPDDLAAPVPLRCHVREFIDFDLTGSIKVADKVTFHINVLNVFDVKPPFDPNTYGGNNYNPAFAQAGIVGRYLRAGVDVKF